jgi:hypothetical protein
LALKEAATIAVAETGAAAVKTYYLLKKDSANDGCRQQ